MAQFIGIAGQPNAGKGATAGVLKALLLPRTTSIIEFGDPYRAAAFHLGLPDDRDTLSALSEFVRNRFDPALTAKRIHQLALEARTDYVLMVGVRKMAVDVPMVRSFPGSLILFVTAPRELRYEFGIERNRGGEAGKTFSEFCAQDELETEREIRAIGELADYTIINDRRDRNLSHIRQQLLRGICTVLPA